MTEASFDLAAWLDDTRAVVDAELDRIFPMPTPAEDPGRLREGMRYAVLLGGKRMRPLCTAAACIAAGGTVRASLPGGCALEMIHAYSLVHDDLPAMDNDLERRGKPTVHVAFGHANAILIGDALLTQAFLVLARGSEGSGRERLAEAVVKLAHHAGIEGMVGGQAADLALGQAIQDLSTLEHVHALKTGALYAAAGALGGLLAGADAERVARLERWGLCFGIAFQHADDILDDDQAALREQAVARVEELVAECRAIAASFGPDGHVLGAVAQWVLDRTHAAHRGAKFE